MNYEGLREVKMAHENGDITLACTLLLDYYKNSNKMPFVWQVPVFSKNINTVADSNLQNIFTFYNKTYTVPRDSNGHLKWNYHGPEDDIEWAWALNRHHHLGILLDAYLQSGNPDYSRAIDSNIKDWIISSLPYPGKKSGTELWRGLEVSFRIKVWARIFYTLMNCDDLCPATRLLILSSISDHAHYSRNFHNQGNWLTMEMSGLAMAAISWPEFNESPSWIAYSKETITKSMMGQVYPDGVQTELTSGYHLTALVNFNLFRDICLQSNESLPEIFEEQIEKMWNYLAYTMRPDGYSLLNNDSDLRDNREKVINASTVYKRKDWLYLATNGKEGQEPYGEPSVFFPYAGHLIMRSGYEPEAQYGFFDIGPWGTGHQHNDKLNISISAFGQEFLVDGGRFAYTGEVAKKFRSYARGSSGHNVILIDGNGQAPGPNLANQPLNGGNFTISEKFDYAWGSFNKFNDTEGICDHTRALLYVRDKFWIVVDRISTDRPRKIETLWHWHPDCTVEPDGKNSVSGKNSKGNLEIIPVGFRRHNLSFVKGQEKPVIQGWYSKQYNSAVPNVTSIYSDEIKGNTTFVWILYPSSGKLQPIKAKLVTENETDVNIRVTNAKGDRWEITIPFSNSNKVVLRSNH
ncbi:MAG: alginate lyase family protein [Bacteroidia bacterium]|nr:alginate lyase family protein [Bacteroidia bacterium]